MAYFCHFTRQKLRWLMQVIQRKAIAKDAVIFLMWRPKFKHIIEVLLCKSLKSFTFEDAPEMKGI